ncbi:hypothetical protein CP967_30355 [Streptomyces nitrosporeus]|uniref:Uncharacterized protein n=1 Tax=Streptomyces nitrosporeus TaxID=28894 RepID=A0A5J6FI50_9ACTN|nr:hypothetical protein CP967_30355 [Streptomyces nitrosporeus]GGY87437.1 hypothetical protein GCM10010327_17540 [Streptomyces nitrosporeus]
MTAPYTTRSGRGAGGPAPSPYRWTSEAPSRAPKACRSRPAAGAVPAGPRRQAVRRAPPPTPGVLLGRVLRRVSTGRTHGPERRTRTALVAAPGTGRDGARGLSGRDPGGGTRRREGRPDGSGRRLPGGRSDGRRRPADAAARTMTAAARGFVAQEALSGGAGPGAPGNGLRGLMSTGSRELS